MGQLSGTSHVILGMLGLSPMSGYDIKSFIDISTSHFWSISYGQLYPELTRLEASGLVGREEPEGGRRRTVYHLTAAGEAALVDWLTSTSSQAFDLRDELLLKLFFADRLPRERVLELLRSMRRRHEAELKSLRETEQAGKHPSITYPYLVLRFGIEFHEWVLEWCARAERELPEAKENDVRETRAVNQ